MTIDILRAWVWFCKMTVNSLNLKDLFVSCKEKWFFWGSFVFMSAKLCFHYFPAFAFSDFKWGSFQVRTSSDGQEEIRMKKVWDESPDLVRGNLRGNESNKKWVPNILRVCLFLSDGQWHHLIQMPSTKFLQTGFYSIQILQFPFRFPFGFDSLFAT